MVAARVADLTDYQHAAYAAGYLREVADVAAAEQDRCPGADPVVTRAFAAGLHKLMAYKDEYEVARLHRLEAERARLAGELGPGRAKVMLHPPVLRALGMKRKVSLGPAAGPAFRVLRAGRRLRGTPFDPFGRTAMRRTERQLVDEYRRIMADALPHLRPEHGRPVARIAALPDGVRGYESVKAAGVERFRADAATALGVLRAEPSPAYASLPS